MVAEMAMIILDVAEESIPFDGLQAGSLILESLRNDPRFWVMAADCVTVKTRFGLTTEHRE